MLLKAVTVLFLTTSFALASIDYHTLRRAEDGLLRPPQPPLNLNVKPEEVPAIYKSTMEKYKVALDRVGNLEAKDCNFSSVFYALEESEAQYLAEVFSLFAVSGFTSSQEMQDAIDKTASLSDVFEGEQRLRQDIQTARVNAETNLRTSGEFEKLTDEEKRLVVKMMLESKKNGIALDETEREKYKQLDLALRARVNEYSNNLNTYAGHMSFTADELDGVSANALASFKKRTENGEDVYDVSLQEANQIQKVIKNAIADDVRRRAYEGFNNRMKENVPVLADIVNLRRQMAKLLGYESWAAYRLEDKMAKNTKTVNDFLDDIQQRLATPAKKELAVRLANKKIQSEKLGIPFDNVIRPWDDTYYSELPSSILDTATSFNTTDNPSKNAPATEKTSNDIDGKADDKGNPLQEDLGSVEEYFPVSFVVPAVIKIYEDLLGVRFEVVHDTVPSEQDIQLFAVWDKDARDESGFLGYCYLDLFPRAGKNGSGEYAKRILGGRALPGNKRVYPVQKMVANMNKPTPDHPALLSHANVVAFFHEMGHVFHNLLSQTQFARFQGSQVAQDFGEAPSQMLENWCWNPKVLGMISSHYKTQNPLPKSYIDRIVKNRFSEVGLFNLKAVMYSKFDIQIHTQSEDISNTTAIWNQMWNSITMEPAITPIAGEGDFTHLVIGYDVGYYGYLYSRVFAEDMYATMFNADPLDPAKGKLYREKILRWGGSRDDAESLKDFLGRPPNSDAFMELLFGQEAKN